MLYRQELLDLGGIAERYVAELSCRRRQRLGEQILAVHALLSEYGRNDLLDAMLRMSALDAYGAEYLDAALTSIHRHPLQASATVPAQSEVDRPLNRYESFAIISIGGAAR